MMGSGPWRPALSHRAASWLLPGNRAHLGSCGGVFAGAELQVLGGSSQQNLHTELILSRMLLLLLLLLLSWLLGDTRGRSPPFALESLSPGATWAGPGEDRVAGWEEGWEEGRYAALSSATRSAVGVHFVKPAWFWRKSTAVPCTAR